MDAMARMNCVKKNGLRHDPVAGPILPGNLHAPLLHERPQQFIERLHHVRVTVDLERTMFLHAPHAIFLDVAGHDARESTPKIRRQCMRRATVMQIQRCHCLMRGHEWLLELQRNIHGPVVEERVLLLDAVITHATNPGIHPPGYFRRITDDDLLTFRRLVAQGQANEAIDLLEIGRCQRGAGEDQRERTRSIFLAQQDAQQI